MALRSHTFGPVRFLAGPVLAGSAVAACDGFAGTSPIPTIH